MESIIIDNTWNSLDKQNQITFLNFWTEVNGNFNWDNGIIIKQEAIQITNPIN